METRSAPVISPAADSGATHSGASHPAADSPAADSPAAGRDFAEQVEALQAATRVLAGVALHSLDILDGVTTLPQFRMLAVLAVLGRARSARVARALALDASTVTRLADRLVAAGQFTVASCWSPCLS